MDNRTTTIGGIWANGAVDPVSAPVAGTTYAKSELTQALIEAGWPFSVKVDSANFNEIMRRVTTLLGLLEQWGVLPWCEFTVYAIGGRALGSNGTIYKAIQASTNKDPISYPDYWEADGGVLNYAVATGAANVYAITIPQNMAVLTPGLPMLFKVNVTNTGASTLNVNGLGAVPLKKSGTVSLAAGDLLIGQVVIATFDGANIQIQAGAVAYMTDIAAHNISRTAHADIRALVSGISLFSSVNIETGSRVVGTTYTNTTREPMFVLVSLTGTNYVAGGWVDGVQVCTAGVAISPGVLTDYPVISLVVPIGKTYKVTDVSGVFVALDSWVEFY